ncbi:CDP-glycerol glycerophosphotransferase family protein [Nesterenkonia halophila]|uniref:CDP-glycerol glycerophosphotransferase family protein n=1 Tax=Nesterenkonia halophila TaxID=302044 RepID=UPI001FE90649|nr:CDP-glycerol glycerophosphotransferase family protein [Nesterenkonia halophila]
MMPHALSVLVWGARAVYSGLKLLPVQRKVVLMTRDLNRMEADFALLRESLRARHPDHRIAVLEHKKFASGYVVAALREMYHLATCRAILVDGYIVPVSVLRHRRGLPVGQLWHAMGGFKNFAYLTEGTADGPDPKVAEVMRMHDNYTFLCSSGRVPSEVFSRAFRAAPETIRPYGMARVDYLLDGERMDAARERVVRRHPRLAEGRIVLYAPTSRRLGGIPYGQLAEAFREQADGQDTLVLLRHPHDRSRVPGGEQTVDGGGIGVLDWLAAADAVITDYSSIVYEAALRDIPTIFFAYDLEEFRSGRGIPLDYEAEAPGPIVVTAEDAVRHAVTPRELDYRSWRRRHLDSVVAEDGSLPAELPGCADRIVGALQLER